MRLRLVLMFVVMVAGCLGQNLTLTHDSPNGLFWLGTSLEGKQNFVSGVMFGAVAASTPRVAGSLPSCPTPPVSDFVRKWSKAQNEIVTEVYKFYTNPANISLPTIVAVVYSIMKLNGASPLDLELYRKVSLRTYVN
jgi:hypothetical protein